MNSIFKSAKTAWHVFVYLNDNGFRALAGSSQMGSTWSKVKVSVFVHRRHLEHCHVHTLHIFAVIARQLGIADGRIIGHALGDHLALDAAHVPGVPCHVCSRIFNFENLRFPHQDTATEVHIVKLRKTFGKFFVEIHRCCYGPAVIHPVS